MLTRREKQVLSLIAAGLSVKEIADHICRSEFTVQKIICNIKIKTGFQKATELVALYFCTRLNLDFGEFKRQVMAAGMVILLCFAEYGLHTEFVRFRSRQNHTKVIICRNRRKEEFNFINV
jgi:DNA-binding CsgD family transcriptional regulator